MIDINTTSKHDNPILGILRDVDIPDHDVFFVEGKWPITFVILRMPTGSLTRGLHGFFDVFVPTRQVLLHETTGGRRRQKFQYRKGDVGFNAPEAHWSIEWTGRLEGVTIVIDPAVMKRFARDHFGREFESIHWRTALSDYMPTIAYLALDIVSQCATDFPIGRKPVELQIETMLTLMLRRYSTTLSTNSAEIGINSTQVLRAVNYVNQNLKRDLSTEQICEIGAASPAQMNRLFRAELGHSIWQYVRQKRLRAAADDLRLSGEKIGTIANRYRFSSRTTFSNQFKSHFGITPGQYRNFP